MPRLTRFVTVQLQIEEISRKLRTGDLAVATTEERFEPPFSIAILRKNAEINVRCGIFIPSHHHHHTTLWRDNSILLARTEASDFRIYFARSRWLRVNWKRTHRPNVKCDFIVTEQTRTKPKTQPTGFDAFGQPIRIRFFFLNILNE